MVAFSKKTNIMDVAREIEAKIAANASDDLAKASWSNMTMAL